MTALEDKLWGERETLRQQGLEIRERLGLGPGATHAEVLERLPAAGAGGFHVEHGRPVESALEKLATLRAEREAICAAVSVPADASETVLMQAVDGYRMAFNRGEGNIDTLARENGELHRQLAEVKVLNDWLRAELDATTAEQPRDQAQPPLFAEVDPAQQQRPRLALVPVEDPPLEQAGEAIVAAVSAVLGVESVAVDPLQTDPAVFVVAVRGGDDQAVARAILRTFPQGSVSTAGNTRIEVDGQVVWLGRRQPPANLEDPSQCPPTT